MNLDDLTYTIIGCAMQVHSQMGTGFQEFIYQRCIAIELKKKGISFEKEVSKDIYYEGEIVGTRRADIIVAGQVLVELKAISIIDGAHLAQAKNYLKAFQLPIGLLINFGAKSLEYKKVFPPSEVFPNHPVNSEIL